ncbi:MAG TPA: hypothetical protein PKD10_16290 [Paracoccaceae bacterium]|nr:hypothetical protein [Paracoccaceae bacterium]HMO73061.1 hypothetical protein [Paracoccaceae bacterium]
MGVAEALTHSLVLWVAGATVVVVALAALSALRGRGRDGRVPPRGRAPLTEFERLIGGRVAGQPPVRPPAGACRWVRDSFRTGGGDHRWVCDTCAVEAYTPTATPPATCLRGERRMADL